MEFFPTVPTFVVFTGACVCAGDRIYCRTFRLKEACISGNSGTVGRKPDKGKLFSAPSGKRLLPCLLCEKFSVLWPALFLAGLPVWREKRSFGGLSRQKENDIAFGRYSGFLEHGTYGAKMAYENECSWNRRRVWWNHFSGSLYLPSFIGWQNFYKENVVTRIMAKIGKDYSMLIYVCIMRCCRRYQSALKAGILCWQEDTDSMG